MFTIVQSPVHGTVDLRSVDGVHLLTSAFTMEDVYENRVSYEHDGTENFEDNFSFTVSDGTNEVFVMQQDEPSETMNPISSPQVRSVCVCVYVRLCVCVYQYPFRSLSLSLSLSLSRSLSLSLSIPFSLTISPSLSVSLPFSISLCRLSLSLSLCLFFSLSFLYLSP